MPKIINTVQFKNNLKNHVDNIDGYFIVAKENSKNKAFIVMDCDIAIGMFIRAGAVSIANEISGALDAISQKVSEKYRKIRKVRSIAK